MSSEKKVIALFILGGKHFYFQSIWKDNEFEIFVSDGRLEKSFQFITDLIFADMFGADMVFYTSSVFQIVH